VRRGVDPDLIIRHPDGFHMAIAMSCTDSAGASPLRPQDLAPPILLDFAGLCQMAQFIEELRHLGGLPHEDCVRDSGQVWQYLSSEHRAKVIQFMAQLAFNLLKAQVDLASEEVTHVNRPNAQQNSSRPS
jgi:hypothetical protein